MSIHTATQSRRAVIRRSVLADACAAIVGCGQAGSGGPGAPQGAPASGPVSMVVYSNWTTGARGDYMRWLKNAFEAETPAITMELEFATGNDFLTKLYAMISGGTMPDLAMMWGRDSCKFMNKGAFLDLTRYLQTAKWQWDRFLTADPASFRDQNKTYGLPHMYTTPMLAANMALFAKAQPWAFPQSVDWYAAVSAALDTVGLGAKTADEACRAAAGQGDAALKKT